MFYNEGKYKGIDWKETGMSTKNNNEVLIKSSAVEYLTYVASTGESSESFEMRYEDENIWLTQKMMAALYDVSLSTINEHITKVYADKELEEGSTIRKFRIVQNEGGRQVGRQQLHYNLQMIIAVGFKVNNDRAVRFRKWAGQIVKDHTIQGWTKKKVITMDDLDEFSDDLKKAVRNLGYN